LKFCLKLQNAISAFVKKLPLAGDSSIGKCV